MTPIVLRLPYPISANRYWRLIVLPPRRAMTTVSTEAKQYKKDVAAAALKVGVKEPIQGKVRVEYWLYPHLPKDAVQREKKLGAEWDEGVQCLDVDNVAKVLMDSLKNVVIADDKWVWALHGYRQKPDGEARLIVRITEWKHGTPQGK